MATVAQAAGVHQTTVSRALRNDQRLPQVTRERIQALATTMGYRPHPLVSALISLRRSRQPPDAPVTIAFVTRETGLGEASQLHHDGAKATLEQMGYRLETFVVGAEGLGENRLDSILKARNIHGVIIAALPEASGHFQLDWPHFAAVVIEYTFNEPLFDRVVHDSYEGMRQVMVQCRARGFRRVGLTLSEVGHARTNELNGAAYWIEQKSGRFFTPIPPLFLPTWNLAAFDAWAERHQPDVIVSSNAFMPSLLARCAQRGLRPGQDIGLINVNALRRDGVSGIVQDSAALGARAARLILEKLNLNERGLPRIRQTSLMPGRWFEGTSLAPARVN